MSFPGGTGLVLITWQTLPMQLPIVSRIGTSTGTLRTSRATLGEFVEN